MTWWVQWQHRAQGLFVLDGRQGLMSLSPQPSKGRSTLTCSPHAGATDAQAMAGPGCLWREVPQLCLFLWISRWTVVKLPQAFSFFLFHQLSDHRTFTKCCRETASVLADAHVKSGFQAAYGSVWGGRDTWTVDIQWVKSSDFTKIMSIWDEYIP